MFILNGTRTANNKLQLTQVEQCTHQPFLLRRWCIDSSLLPVTSAVRANCAYWLKAESRDNKVAIIKCFVLKPNRFRWGEDVYLIAGRGCFNISWKEQNLCLLRLFLNKPLLWKKQKRKVWGKNWLRQQVKRIKKTILPAILAGIKCIYILFWWIVLWHTAAPYKSD